MTESQVGTKDGNLNLWTFMFIVGFPVFGVAATRNLPWVIYILAIFASLQIPGGYRKCAFICLSGAASLTLFSPVDVCVRDGKEPGISIAVLVYQVDTNQQVKTLRDQGMTENVDYVVYRRLPLFNRATSVLVLRIGFLNGRQELARGKQSRASGYRGNS